VQLLAWWYEMEVDNGGLQEHLLFGFWYCSGRYYILTYSALLRWATVCLYRGSFRQL